MSVIKDLLAMTRIYPELWWKKYALLSILLPWAILFYEGVAGPDSVSKMLPLLAILFLLYCFTFLLNHITDVKEDRYKPAAPVMTKKGKSIALILCGLIIISELIIISIFLEAYAILIFLLLQLFSVMYSWGPRLKETTWGPLVGSMFFWGPVPLIAIHLTDAGALGIHLFPPALRAYLAVMFLFGLKEELEHSIYDYDVDKRAALKTLAQRLGIERTRWAIRVTRLMFLLSLLLLSYLISRFTFGVALLFILLAVTGTFSSKHFFTVIFVMLILSGELRETTVILLFLAIPSLSDIVTDIGLKLRAAFHRIYAAYRETMDHIHRRHRQEIFSRLERIK